MILENLPKIMRIDGGIGTIESEEFSLENYRAAAFFFENENGKSTTVKVKSSKEDGTAEYVPFLIKTPTQTEYEETTAEGKTLTDSGQVVAVITADMLSHNEFDRVTLELTAEGELTAVYALQTQPRYSE